MASENHSSDNRQAPRAGGNDQREDRCCIVGIGASAGGLKALNALFSELKGDSGMAFVIVQHLDPDHKTLLPELLEKRTAMPVALASEGMEILPDQVYIIPPDTALTIRDGVLHTADFRQPRGQRAPIDLFFRSLAQDRRERAIAILLSGNGSDGTLGLKEVKEMGGLVLAQDPETAEYGSMPHSAIQTGLVDFVLEPSDIPEKLRAYDIDKVLATRITAEEGPGVPKSDLIESIGTITAMLHRITGHDFKGYKRSTLARRIQRRITLLNLEGVDEYITLLQQEPSEAEALFRDFLISVTHFFRDPEAFRALATEAIPGMVRENVENGLSAIRIWVPGCATGEEAYSLGMLLLDYCERHNVQKEIKIFATDIDLDALEVARQGSYPEGIAEQIPENLLERYFTKEEARYRVRKHLRDLIIFSPHNIVKDPPFSRLDMISCRNLLIYLQAEEQKRLMRVLHYALRNHGVLFLGSSENAAAHSNLFRVLSKSHRIFRRKEDVIGSPVETRGTDAYYSLYRSTGPAGRNSPVDESSHGRRAVERIVLREHSPAFVVVNEDRQVIFSSGNTSDFLVLPEGAISTNVIDMARRGLRLDLRSALHDAFGSGEPIQKGPGTLEMSNGEIHQIRITVRPVDEVDAEEPIMLVLFEDLGERQQTEVVVPATIDENHPALVHLEEELRSTREQLQTTIEELETTNEELKSSNEELLSMNEELQSSNEELQTSKEEIQSINEELYTVNAELNQKIEELNHTNSDLHNLLQSTHIPTIFVDGNMRITRFTPEAKELFRIIDGDLGRRIRDVKTSFDEKDLEQRISEVTQSLIPFEEEIEIPGGQTFYLMRIIPYRTINNVIDGVVITFTDITFVRRAEAGERYLQAMFEYVPEGIMVVDAATKKTSFISREGYRMLGREASYYNEPIGEGTSSSRTLRADGITEYEISELPVIRAMEMGEIVRNEKLYIEIEGKTLPLICTAAPIPDDAGRVVAAVATWRDISDLEKIQDELTASNERYRAIASELESLYQYMPIGLSVLDEDLRYVRINKYMADRHGVSIEDHVGEYMFDIVPEVRETVEPILRKVLETGEPAIELEVQTPTLAGGDGEEGEEGEGGDTSYWYASYFRLNRDDGEGSYLVSIVRNITKKRKAQIALEESRAELRSLNEELEERVEKRTEQVRSLSAALALAERSERRRLSFLLHDDLQQILFGLEMKFQLVQQRLRDEDPTMTAEAIIEEMNDLDETLLQAIQVTRTLSVELNPPLEHDSGVEAALRWIVEHMEERHGLSVDLDVEEDLRMPNVDMRALMVQLVRELLFNIVKHSGVMHACLRAESIPVDCIAITVEDEGEGFTPSDLDGEVPGGLGLYSIRERVTIVGGSVDISSTPGKGTSITVSLPLSV